MSEMLGNQYFMARNYLGAIEELEPLNNENKAVRRKLIICYVQANQMDKALDYFYSLVKEDVRFIMDADPVFDDCPCPEIVTQFDESGAFPNSTNSNLANGILWLYCDTNNSLKYLEKAKEDFPEKEQISKSIKIIENEIRG